MAPDPRALAKSIDHTLLKPTAKDADIRQLCAEAAEEQFASVCIPPAYVPAAAKELRGTGVDVATVVSFPLGYDPTAVKVAAVREAIDAGAVELDMVLNVSQLLSGASAYVGDELAAVVEAASAASDPGSPALVKVIIETAYLDEALKREATRLVADSGAAFVKTSTGFAPSGATVADVALLRAEAPSSLQVKASGGIRTLGDARAMLDAGATRLGVSSGVAIIAEAKEQGLAE